MGAFYSPKSLVDPIVDWAVTGPGQSVLDPSCGDGAFLESASRRLLALGDPPHRLASRLRGVDLDWKAAQSTARRLREPLRRRRPEVLSACFFDLEPPGGASQNAAVDAVIGNPPYIRYQEFNGSARDQALRRSQDAGVTLTRLTSSWAPFVVHAVRFVKPGGRLGLILPAELIHAAYAAPLRRFLRESFATVHLVSFRRAVFPEVEEEVVVLLAEGRGERRSGRLGIVEVEDGTELAGIREVLLREEVFEAGVEPEKWVAGSLRDPSVAILDRLKSRGLFCHLGDVGKANIGFVSGANDFFVVTPGEASTWRLPESSLRPALIRARQIPGLILTRRDLSNLIAHDERCLLWSPGQQLGREERAYLRHGETLGIAFRYKCRTRSPWHAVPGVIAPEAFLTYMSDVIPRLCLNRAKAVAANTLLTIRLKNLPKALHLPFSVAFYNSATLLSCERTGRSYGGGVLKLEPREADRTLVPGREIIERNRESLVSLAGVVDEELKKGSTGRLREAIGQVDRVIFGTLSEVDSLDVQLLSRARESLLARRRTRARTSLARAHVPS